MNTDVALANESFHPEQKEYLQGFFAGLAFRQPFVGHLPNGQITSTPAPGLANSAEEPPAEEQMVYGTPLSDLCEQELWKLEKNGLDTWDDLLAHAEADKLPDKKFTYYFRNFGLFNVSPAQNSMMLRLRIPGGEMTHAQLRGVADLAEEWGGGYAHVTTRSNLQIREIKPRNMVKVLNRLQELGLTARGAGVDNVRNITASPTAGIDPAEFIDTRPMAKALHYYILNNRDLYGLPRKFNVSFDGGGAIGNASDTNDIAFMAVRVPEGKGVEAGVYFRVELAGITGHEQFASDTGVIIKPQDAVAVAAAIIRVFVEHGDRTNRKKARLKYLIDKWGTEKFMEEVEKKLAFPLLQLPLAECQRPQPSIPHAHFGVYKQKQPNLNWVGAVIAVGMMKPKQMRRLADVAQNYGSGTVRLTVWQNLIIPDVPDAYLGVVKKNLVKMGFNHEASAIMGGLVACTGSFGCKWASTDTKSQAVELGRHLEKRVKLDHPLNIHLTGCPNSCAQHYIGDIGLLGAKVSRGGEQVEGYHVLMGGQCVAGQALGREVFHGIAFIDLPALLEEVLKQYLARRRDGHETFAQFTGRHSVKELQEFFSN